MKPDEEDNEGGNTYYQNDLHHSNVADGYCQLGTPIVGKTPAHNYGGASDYSMGGATPGY
jgi:hypothetical protein